MKPSNQNFQTGTKSAHEPVPRDKQLQSVNLIEVMEKCRLDQALNIKEFARRVDISYSTAREWFNLPGFPAFRGVVFYGDFIKWRVAQASAAGHSSNLLAHSTTTHSVQQDQPAIADASNRAKQILDEATNGTAKLNP